MPPKKRDKDEGSKNVSRDIQAEHELFLQAFEKPTQIYRYLRTRNMISPVFLHRTLTYMKHRMSRNHKRRSGFRIDNMLSEKINKSRLDRSNGLGLGDYMSLMFLGFFDKTLCNDFIMYDIVRVETILLKISHKKRKDSSSSYMQESFGTSDIAVNPTDEQNEREKIPAISIPTGSFTPMNGTPHNQSYILLLKVETIPKLNNLLSDDGEEPCSKRQKSNTTKIYGSELVIFDKHSRCLLAEGEYELALSEILSTTKSSSPKKHTTWEIIPDDINMEISDKFDNRYELFNKCPTLKFYLKWTNEPCTGYVDKPKPIMITTFTAPITIPSSTIIQTSTTGNCTATTITSTTAGETLTNGINTRGNLNEIKEERENNLINGGNSNNNNNNCTSNKNRSAIKNGIQTTNMSIVNYTSNRAIERIQTVYQFIYNNNSRQQTEPCDDMHCPWCSLDCMTLYSLLKHLKLCHARFTFTYIPVTNGARIDVAINDMYDGSYTGSPHDLVGPAGCAFARSGPVRRTIVTNLLVCRPRRQKPNLTEFLELDENELNNQRPYITGHNRLYHHTETCLPVHPKELDIDSEGESDPLWLQHKTMQMIDEFTDVNEGEKELMKMWNLHVMKHGYVGDCQLPIACDMFLDMRGRELLQKNLYRNFVLHMCSLFDYGLVSPEVVYKTIQKLQNILSTYPEGRKVIAESREAQLDYWLKVGINKQAQQEELKQKQQHEQYHLRHQQKDLKSSSSSSVSLCTNSSSKKYIVNGNENSGRETSNKKTIEKNRLSSKESITDIHHNKIMNGNNGRGSGGGGGGVVDSQQKQQQQSTISGGGLQRKRSINSIQNESSITGKRRLSQLRDSPPRRRSVPTFDQQTSSAHQNSQQQQPKLIPARRQSIALFNHGSGGDTKTITTSTATSNNLLLSSSTSSPSSSSSLPNTNIQQTMMRKRILSIAKVDKH